MGEGNVDRQGLRRNALGGCWGRGRCESGFLGEVEGETGSLDLLGSRGETIFPENAVEGIKRDKGVPEGGIPDLRDFRMMLLGNCLGEGCPKLIGPGESPNGVDVRSDKGGELGRGEGWIVQKEFEAARAGGHRLTFDCISDGQGGHRFRRFKRKGPSEEEDK